MSGKDKTYKATVYYKSGSGYRLNKVYHVTAPEMAVATLKVYAHFVTCHLIYKLIISESKGEEIIL